MDGAGITDKVADFEPLYVAVISALCVVPTVDVVIVKIPEV